MKKPSYLIHYDDKNDGLGSQLDGSAANANIDLFGSASSTFATVATSGGPDVHSAIGGAEATASSLARADSDGAQTETIGFSGSGIVFVNTFNASANANPAYKSAIIAAEQEIASSWSNSITLRLDFDTNTAGQNGTLASNNWPSGTSVSYATLRSALSSHASGDTMPTSDPNPAGGNDWYLPEAYARMLGLSSSTPTYDDTIVLNTSYNWTYGQDVIDAIEHEITEGAMGRIGGLGYQNSVWSTMDLFRYSAANTHYYTWDNAATYFSPNGSNLSLISFDTSATGGDVADFNAHDVFGYGYTGETNKLSAIDNQVMNALGWTSTTNFYTSSPQIMFQNTSGPLELWQMSGTTVVGGGQVAANPGPTWSAMVTGDFFGDGNTAILFQNDDGSVALWDMDGINVVGGGLATASNPGPTWHIKSTGDFLGDGNTDILWQNDNGSVALWDMSGTNIVGGGLVTASNPGPTWHIEGTGDFFGDGNTAILFQNDDGSVALWDMNGTSIIGGGLVANNPGPTWQIKGTGDFYDDGHTGILFQNDDGSVAVWDMSGTNIVGGGLLTAANPGPTWHIKGTGDFNSDGHTDIAFQNDDGTVAIWEMSGTNVIGGGAVVDNPGTAWNLIDATMRFIYSTSANETLKASPATPDEFVFTGFATGSHTISGFNPVQDLIEFSKAQFASFADVQASTSAITAGAMINLGGGSSLLLPGVNAGSLHASNFVLA